jgi:hypothetical protein
LNDPFKHYDGVMNNLEDAISGIDDLNQNQDGATARKLAIAKTHLDTARLFLKDAAE